MSPLAITLFVVTGVLALGIIMYASHAMEKAKLDKARLKADLIDRCKRCERLSMQLPGQFMSLQLKAVLQRIQLSYLEQLAKLDRNDPSIQSRMSALRNPLDNASAAHAEVKVRNEEVAKELRFQLEALNAQIVHAGQVNIISRSETQHWAQEIRHMLINLNLELFHSLGENALRAKQGGQAKIAYERALQYLSKLPERDQYGPAKQKLEERLALADTMVVHHMTNSGNAATELVEGIKTLEQEEEEKWKRKSVYD